MAKRKPKGLGDTIEAITEATGIKAAVELFSSITGLDCGCNERKEKLNRLITYKRSINCLNEQDYNALKPLVDIHKADLSPKEQSLIIAIYERVFNEKLEASNCSGCWRDILADLRKVYNAYE